MVSTSIFQLVQDVSLITLSALQNYHMFANDRIAGDRVALSILEFEFGKMVYPDLEPHAIGNTILSFVAN
jgi:hypothetical protein